MNRIPRFCAAGLAVLLSFALVGCSSSAVRDLQLVVAGGEAVVAALESAGTIPAPAAALINTYMGQVSAFVSFSTTELASSDSPAVKASKIAAEAVGISKPDLPSGTPTLVATSIQAVASALANFLSNIAATSAQLSVSPQFASGFGAKKKAPKLDMSASDKKKLAELHARAVILQSKFPKKQ
jgi:hypothetical protein